MSYSSTSESLLILPREGVTDPALPSICFNPVSSGRPLEVDIDGFVRSSMHCLSKSGGGKISRPFGPASHCNSSNSLLQSDCIKIEPFFLAGSMC